MAFLAGLGTNYEKNQWIVFTGGKSRSITTNYSHHKPVGFCTNDEKSEMKDNILGENKHDLEA